MLGKALFNQLTGCDNELFFLAHLDGAHNSLPAGAFYTGRHASREKVTISLVASMEHCYSSWNVARRSIFRP